MCDVLKEFIEEAEQFPREVVDTLTNVRELDLGVANELDKLNKKAEELFANASSKLPPELEIEHKQILTEYSVIMQLAEEKVLLATEATKMLYKLKKRLDICISKTKKALDKDSPGTSERIERKVAAELDQPFISSSQKENKHSNKKTKSRDKPKHKTRKEKLREFNSSTNSIENGMSQAHISYQEPASASSSHLSQQASSSSSGASAAVASNSSVGSVNYNLDRIGFGVNAIAAAASQAIAATQQMQQGRRTASLKASIEAINTGGVHAAEFSRELAGAAQTATAATQELAKKNKKKVISVNGSSSTETSVQQQTAQQQQHTYQQDPYQQQSAVASTGNQQVGKPNDSTVTMLGAEAAAAIQTNDSADMINSDYVIDEKKYCICDQVSCGEVVACDNANCPYEWFHYPCVNITVPPKGKWYCPRCNTANKRRASRKN